MKKFIKYLATGAAALAFTVGSVSAQTVLRAHTHQGETNPYGQLIKKFAEDVETMSGGELKFEVFYSSSLVGSAETWDAAINGIVDCDVTGAAYQGGKNTAFQFVGDLMGGYDTPIQWFAWVEHGGGREFIDDFYADYNMTFFGHFFGGHESLNSTRPLRSFEDLKDFKFRSPPGLETEIFASLGASPIVMDFTDVFTSLETGIIDGADYSTLANNLAGGIYDITKYTTYPGFHSMPADHLACRSDAIDNLSDEHRRIIEVAWAKAGFDLILLNYVLNADAVAKAPSLGLTLHDWSTEDRLKFRQTAREAWRTYAGDSPEAAVVLDSHEAFMTRIGLL